MASFYAELHLAGQAFPVLECVYAFHQETDSRGRASAKVRHGPLQLRLDVPPGSEVLLDWAATAHKPLAGQVVFYDEARAGVARESIAFAAGQCVHYEEDFVGGDAATGAYTCALTVTAPAFALHVGGGPAAAAAGAVATMQGQPDSNIALPSDSTLKVRAQEVRLHEAVPGDEGALPALAALSAGAVALSPALAKMLETTFVIAKSAGASGPADFETAVKADLQAIYSTPTGQKLLESIHASGKKIYINYGEKNAVVLNRDTWMRAFYQLDGVTPGAGLAVPVEYNPAASKTGVKAWNSRPAGIGLAHELIHVEQAAHGRMQRFETDNPGGIDTENKDKPPRVPIFELETLGVPPHDQYSFTENKIRAEWHPPQPLREYY